MKCQLCRIRDADVECDGCGFAVCGGCIAAVVECNCADQSHPWVHLKMKGAMNEPSV